MNFARGASLADLVPHVNTFARKTVIKEEGRWKLSHPLGMSHFHQAVARADNEYAEQNDIVFQTLADWRKRIKAEIATWKK